MRSLALIFYVLFAVLGWSVDGVAGWHGAGQIEAVGRGVDELIGKL